MTIVASAPGKIVLSGEYAVLDGEPAICVAVDRRARVTVEDSENSLCQVMTPGFSGDDRFGIIDAVTGGARPSAHIEMDTRAFSHEGTKTGIGSSAALTVALVAALGETDDVFQKALHAHRTFQGGAGSGVDIAAAIHGGLIEYEMNAGMATSLDWPEGLHMRVLWTGVPASTEAKLQQLAAQAPRPSRAALLLEAPRMAEAWRSGNADRLMSGYVPYIAALRQFNVDHDLGIFDAGHDQLTDAAMRSDLIYKPAGAGGGDIGVLFGRNEAELDAFASRHDELIHRVLPCALDPIGVHVERR